MASLPSQVKKRDGRIVSFDMRKIASAITKAFAATGEGDSRLALELADVVTMALSRRRPKRNDLGKLESPDARWVPTIEEIQDLVERVLMETGYTQTAKSYILYRDKRAQVRDLLSVRDNENPSAQKFQVQGSRGENASWSKGKIIAALISEAELPRETAEEIAARVERKVFESGIHRLSTTLIRELVDNELFAMGLESKRRRQAILGIPKFDLGQLLKTGFLEKDGETQAATHDPANAAAQVLLERYALEEVLAPEIADQHRDGALHFADLTQLHREFSVAARLPGKISSDPEKLAQEIALLGMDLLGTTSSFVVLEGFESWIAAVSDKERFQQALFDRLRLLRNERNELVLSVPATIELPADISVLRPSTSAEGIWIGPGLSRARGEETPWIGCGATASINLPRLAYESGRWGDSKLFHALVAKLDAAVSGLMAIESFQKSVRFSREATEPRGRVSFAVSLEGLVEAVRFSREGSMDPDLARTIQTVASDFLRDLSIQKKISLCLETASLQEPAMRFARLDFERFPQSRELFEGEALSYHSNLNRTHFSPTS